MTVQTSAQRARARRPSLVVGAVVSPLAVCGLLAGVRDSVTVATAALLLVLLVVGAAATGDRLAGLAAALSSGAWFDFFLTEPYGSFAIDSADDIEVAVLLVLIGAAVSEVALWGRRQQGTASARAGYLQGVLQTAETISLRHEPAEKLMESVAQQIADVLGVAGCRFVAGPVHDPRYAVLERDGSVTRRGHALDVDRDGLPTDEETVLLVRSGTTTLGYFIVTAAGAVARPSAEQRRVAVILADQSSSVLGGT